MHARLPTWSAVALALAAGAALAVAGCRKPGQPAGTAVPQPPTMLHDFGSIPHGQAATHDFVLDTRALGDDYVCLGVHADCSCAHMQMLLRAADGSEREIDGRPLAEFAPRPGEVLVVRARVDTATKEPVDQPPRQSQATVHLQSVTHPDPLTRVLWPLLLRFAIDSPVRLTPFATLDFARVPVSAAPAMVTTLRSDLDHPIRFGPATCADPRLHVELTTEGDAAVLRATFTPTAADEGKPFKVPIAIATDLPDGYRVPVLAVGTVVADLEVTPFAKVSLQCDLAQPQRPEQAATQFVLVTDHDRRRSAEFVVVRIVDDAGRDAAAHFSASLEPLAGDPRTHRLTVRCLGGLQAPFRGRIELAKDRERGPFLPIELVAFPEHRP